jgi:hypothetical protein
MAARGTRRPSGYGDNTPAGGYAEGADVLDLSAQRRETAVQIVRLAKVLQDVQKLAIARGPGPAGSFSLVCEDGKLRVYAHKGDGDGKSLTGSCLPPRSGGGLKQRVAQNGCCTDRFIRGKV